MKKNFLGISLLMFLSVQPLRAEAKLLFGDQDSIHFVANTTIPGPGQSHLFLGHLVTTHAFVLPYSVESRGHVLGVSGESKKYIPLPQGAELADLQARGFLPKPLPPAELSWIDYLIGYSLWLLLFALVVVPLAKKRLFGR